MNNIVVHQMCEFHLKCTYVLPHFKLEHKTVCCLVGNRVFFRSGCQIMLRLGRNETGFIWQGQLYSLSLTSLVASESLAAFHKVTVAANLAAKKALMNVPASFLCSDVQACLLAKLRIYREGRTFKKPAGAFGACS